MNTAKTGIRNILFITVDQLRGDSLSCLDHPVVTTPNLDRLATKSVRFRQHFAQAVPCGPSRCSLHTSLYVPHHGGWRNGDPIDGRLPNWASAMRANGLDPVLIGFTHTSLDPSTWPLERQTPRGFEGILPGLRQIADFDVGMEAWYDWVCSLSLDRTPQKPSLLLKPYEHEGASDGHHVWGRAPYPAGATDTCFLVDHALAFLERMAGQPWILHLSLFRPHDPYLAPQPYDELYAPIEVPPPEPPPQDDGVEHPYLSWQRCQAHHRPPKEPDSLAAIRALYFGLITEMDAQLGRIFDYLDSNGDAAQTLIIFTSDHGDQLGDQGLMGKVGFFDSSYHVPLILHDPRVEADRTRGIAIDVNTENVDIPPTLLDYIDLPVPPTFQGRSLRPFVEWKGTPNEWRRTVRWAYSFADMAGESAFRALGVTPSECVFLAARDETHTFVNFPSLPALVFDREANTLALAEGERFEELRRISEGQLKAPIRGNSGRGGSFTSASSSYGQ